MKKKNKRYANGLIQAIDKKLQTNIGDTWFNVTTQRYIFAEQKDSNYEERKIRYIV